MRGRNLGTLWDLFGGKYLTTRRTISAVLGLGRESVASLVGNVEVFAVGERVYYRTLDVIDIIENNFRKGT